MAEQTGFPVTELAGEEAHAALARLRNRAPVYWVAELGAWLVTGYAAASAALDDSASFTVEDPRFTTARVIGPSMLSLDGGSHARHRGAFAHAFSSGQLRSRLSGFIESESARLTEAIRPAGRAELRTELAGPLAVAVMAEALGLTGVGLSPETVLGWYRDIAAAVAELPVDPPEGQVGQVTVGSFTSLGTGLRQAIAAGQAPLLAEAAEAGMLTTDEVVSNAALELFGGVETAEAMICNALLYLLSAPDTAGQVRGDPALAPAALEESLRLEPASAVVYRYAAADAMLGGASIRSGDPVIVSIAGANRDPGIFADPDQYDIRRPNASRHLSFARGPHFCLGAPLARLEGVAAVRAALARLPGLRFAAAPPRARGFVFRAPEALPVRWG
jgi:cytochrome P450